MTVYVDDMNRAGRVGRITSRWSHLYADTHAELEDFARQLGLRPSWIQHAGTHREHYDLTAGKRAQALQLGAQPISYLRDVPLLIARRRRALEQQTTSPTLFEMSVSQAPTTPVWSRSRLD